MQRVVLELRFVASADMFNTPTYFEWSIEGSLVSLT
jgi:hypothetical protein